MEPTDATFLSFVAQPKDTHSIGEMILNYLAVDQSSSMDLIESHRCLVRACMAKNIGKETQPRGTCDSDSHRDEG